MKDNESNFAFIYLHSFSFSSPIFTPWLHRRSQAGASRVDRLDRGDLDAEAGKTDIGAWIVGAQPDRGDPEVAQDLRAQSDFAPLGLARVIGADRVSAAQIRRNSRRAVAQIDERATPLGLEAAQNLRDWASAENVAQDIGAVQTRRHVAAIADRSMYEGEMQDRIERRAIGVALKLANRRHDRKARDTLDQLLARLPIGDEIRDRNALDLVLVGEGLALGSDHDGAVVVGEFADDGDRRQAGELAKVDRSLGMAGAHEHPAILGDKGKNMARPDEIARAHV